LTDHKLELIASLAKTLCLLHRQQDLLAEEGSVLLPSFMPSLAKPLGKLHVATLRLPRRTQGSSSPTNEEGLIFVPLSARGEHAGRSSSVGQSPIVPRRSVPG